MTLYEMGLHDEFRNDILNGRHSIPALQTLVNENKLSDIQLEILKENVPQVQQPVAQVQQPQQQSAQIPAAPVRSVPLAQRLQKLQAKYNQDNQNKVLIQGLGAVKQWLDFMETKLGGVSQPVASNAPQQQQPVVSQR